jgi:hypothetical protein
MAWHGMHTQGSVSWSMTSMQALPHAVSWKGIACMHARLGPELTLRRCCFRSQVPAGEPGAHSARLHHHLDLLATVSRCPRKARTSCGPFSPAKLLAP